MKSRGQIDPASLNSIASAALLGGLIVGFIADMPLGKIVGASLGASFVVCTVYVFATMHEPRPRYRAPRAMPRKHELTGEARCVGRERRPLPRRSR